MFENKLVIMAFSRRDKVFHTGEKAEHFKPLFRYIEHNYVLKRWMNRHF